MEAKKILVPMIVAIATLVVLTVGATYAYFAVGTSYESYTTTVKAQAADIGSVALEAGTSLNMNLTAAQMMLQSNDVTYYATANGTPQTTANNVTLATAKVTGAGTFTCNYTLKVAYSGTMKAALPAAGSAILNVGGTDYDVYSTTFPKTISGTLTGLTSSASKTITGSLKVVNLKGTDQSAMAGTNMTLTFTATKFSCTATA